jgi:hypothetical protein
MDRRRFLRQAGWMAAGWQVNGMLRDARAQQTGKMPAPVGDSGLAMEAPAAGYYPYRGVSGAGFPATAESAHGGWRSGSEGVGYAGVHPPRYKTLPFGSSATGSVVKDGLLPPIWPLLDVQVRDTIVCRGGDGQFYMTGSTGDNIWAFNDGVELWKSPDLKQWEYVGVVWSIERDGGWEKQWRSLHNRPLACDLGSGAAPCVGELLHLPEHGSERDLNFEE